MDDDNIGIFVTIRLTEKQKQILKFNCLDLAEIYFLAGEKAFDKKYEVVKSIGSAKKKVLLAFFKEENI